jgi:hypothetical protein
VLDGTDMNALLRTLSVALAMSAAVACSPNIIGGGDGGSGAGVSTTSGSSTGGYTTGWGGSGGYTTSWGGSGGYTTGWGGTTSTWTTSTCQGPIYEWCENGYVYSACCDAGDCAPPEYCDLGNGTCYLGPCNGFPDGGPPCNGGYISASSFNQTCVSDLDCTAVYDGPLCSECYCPNAAINQNALAAYTTVREASGAPPNVCNCPSTPPALCNGGMCTLQ